MVRRVPLRANPQQAEPPASVSSPARSISSLVSRGGTTSGAAAASRLATWRVLMPAACSISSRWSCGCNSGAADDRPAPRERRSRRRGTAG